MDTHSVLLREQAGEQLNVGLASMRQLPLTDFSTRMLPGLTLSDTEPPNWLYPAFPSTGATIFRVKFPTPSPELQGPARAGAPPEPAGLLEPPPPPAPVASPPLLHPATASAKVRAKRGTTDIR